jgi:outer membrane protein
MKLLRLIPIAAAVGLAFAQAARAESLLELYEAARAYDATWQSAKSQYDANRYRAEQARANILPAAGLSAGATRSAFENNNPAADRNFTTQSATLSASQPLYRPANLAAYRQGQRALEQAEYGLTIASQDLIIRVATAYFEVLAAQDGLAFVRAQKAAVAEQLAAAKRNFEVGTTTITDTREAQARYDLVLAQEIQVENDLRVRKLALDTVVGKKDANPNPIATEPLNVTGPQPADPEAWASAAETNSPVILNAKTNVEIAELETEKAKAGHKPTLDLTASYNVTRSPNGSATTIADSKPQTGNVGVAFNLPLFAGFATQNRIRETLALEEKARIDLEAARRNVTQLVRAAYFSVVSLHSRVRALEAAEASSQSSLDANRLGYQVGVRINIDVLNAQSQFFQTKRDLAAARYETLMGHLKLRQVNGTLQPEDLARLNTLVIR